MLLDDLKKNIDVLPVDEATILRDLYIEHFVDTNNEGFINKINKRILFSDGYCYTGYLWDYIMKRQRITLQTLINVLINKETVLVLWDIHSCERIFIEDYWKFGKDSIIRIETKYLIEGLNYFPEDIYIFDSDFLWTYIITHEDDGKRKICYKINLE